MTPYKMHVNSHVKHALNIKDKETKKGFQWDIIIFYLFSFIITFLVGYCVLYTLDEKINLNSNYKIEVINKDSINLYSVKKDTIYKLNKNQLINYIK